jgi:putative multiple sugar transport system substrate-binding protein
MDSIKPQFGRIKVMNTRTFKRAVAALIVAVLCLALASCGGGATGGKTMVGISMPTKSIQRWETDGENMRKGFEDAGYATMVEFANDDTALQVSQLENMINKGCKAIVVAAIDSASLSNVLQQAKDKGIYIISYDRLITDTPNVDFYVTFDNKKVGTEMALYVEKALDLANAAGPINMEISSGPPSDNNAGLIYGGMMEVLQKYIDSGVVVIPSGQTTAEQTAIDNWELANSQTRMENLLNGFYTDKKLNIAICANDTTGRGAANAIIAAGYTPGAADYPIITGQDCEKATVQYIIDGKQSMSIFKDTRTLGEQAMKATISLLDGKAPDQNGTSDNKVFEVPTYNCDLVAVTKDNYKEIFVDGGYYTEADLNS